MGFLYTEILKWLPKNYPVLENVNAFFKSQLIRIHTIFHFAGEYKEDLACMVECIIKFIKQVGKK